MSLIISKEELNEYRKQKQLEELLQKESAIINKKLIEAKPRTESISHSFKESDFITSDDYRQVVVATVEMLEEAGYEVKMMLGYDITNYPSKVKIEVML